MEKGKKVFVALSGGVDSSTAAALLLQRGYDCQAMYMITSDMGVDNAEEVKRIAEKLKIKYHILDFRRDFENVIAYFCDEYKKGRTPNPCVFCNRTIKFGKLWQYAKDHGADLIATGHYANIKRDGDKVSLYEIPDYPKDQSYVLSVINKQVLPNILLVMGEFKKNETRQMAEKFDLGTAHKSDSQEICFIPNDDYISLLEQKCPQLVRKGNIIDISGKVLGQHMGIHRYTIGQRRGLGVAMGKPYYVTAIDSQNNVVTLGPRSELMHKKLLADSLNWLIDEPQEPFEAKVKIRYNDRGKPATVYPQQNHAIVEFEEDVSAITPGQLAVFYIKQGENFRVAGSGWINHAL